MDELLQSGNKINMIKQRKSPFQKMQEPILSFKSQQRRVSVDLKDNPKPNAMFLARI